jgi:hypothetical protein
MSEDIRKEISGLNDRLHQLDSKFNSYFSAKDKTPPIKELDQLKRDVNRTYRKKMVNPSVSYRFFIDTFYQRFVTYRIKWEKRLKDVEEGRAKRGPRGNG